MSKRRAVERLKVGVVLAREAARGPLNLGNALGISSAAVSQWTRVPITHVLKIETLYGIERHRLRPDIYPEPATSVAAQ